MRAAGAIQAGSDYLVSANTPSRLTSAVVRAACYATTDLRIVAFEWLRKNALRSKFAELYEFAAEAPKPPLAAPRAARGGVIFEENDGGDMLQNSECSEISGVRIPTVSFADSVPTPFGPSGHFPLIGGIGPLCPRGALGDAERPGARDASSRLQVFYLMLQRTMHW